MRGVDLILLLKEFLGHADGLCGGRGGHMHLYSQQHLTASSGIVGAAVSAAMAGLRPVVEVMLVDFIAVAMDAMLNHAAKVEAFSAGKWNVPFGCTCCMWWWIWRWWAA
jgi:pyruvate/2-oxoglutarate/acetoin dehydrogenase E1 component